MFQLTLLFALGVVLVHGDITGTNPPVDSCLCCDANSVNIRATACGTVIGTANVGSCFKYGEAKQSCVLSGVTYEFFRIDYAGGVGWVAGTYFNIGSAAQCDAPAPGNCPDFVTRAEWGARPPTSITPISHPIPRVFVHHSEGSFCSDLAGCSSVVRGIQNYHMDTNGWSDIGYNYLIGEDGRIYEGRTWDRVGAHVSAYNAEGLGICMIGSFMTRTPNAIAMQALADLIACADTQNKISAAYTLHGHRDGGATDCPGNALYAEIQGWPHFAGPIFRG